MEGLLWRVLLYGRQRAPRRGPSGGRSELPLLELRFPCNEALTFWNLAFWNGIVPLIGIKRQLCGSSVPSQVDSTLFGALKPSRDYSLISHSGKPVRRKMNRKYCCWYLIEML
jgi:hypothetical protein